MSQVDKIIAKALSTHSEDEAIAALRMARKKYKGDAPSVGKNSDSSELKTMKETATQLQRIAQKWKAEAQHQNNQAIHYYNRYFEILETYKSKEIEISKIKQKLTKKNSSRVHYIMIGITIGSFMGAIVGQIM